MCHRFAKKKNFYALSTVVLSFEVDGLERMRVKSTNIFIAGKLSEMWVTPAQCIYAQCIIDIYAWALTHS